MTFPSRIDLIAKRLMTKHVVAAVDILGSSRWNRLSSLRQILPQAILEPKYSKYGLRVS